MKTLIDAATATTTTPSIKLVEPTALHGVEVFLTGSIATLSVNIKGSISGNVWGNLASYTLSTTEIAAGGVVFHIADKLVEHVKGQIASLATGGDATVSVFYTPYPDFA